MTPALFIIGNANIRAEVRDLAGNGSFRYVVSTDIYPSVKCYSTEHVFDAICSFLEIEDRTGQKAVRHLLDRQLTQTPARAHAATPPKRRGKVQ